MEDTEKITAILRVNFTFLHGSGIRGTYVHSNEFEKPHAPDLSMKAMLLSKYRHLEIADVPTPVPGPGELLVRVAACGICGSDVHGLDGRTGRRIPPLVMGHEAAGEVVETGANVTDLKPGDRVNLEMDLVARYVERMFDRDDQR